MLKKVAVNKNEINELIRLKKYQEAIECVENIRVIIKNMATVRVEKLIENNIILKEEKEIFYKIIEKDINNNLLQDKNYILIDESYVQMMENNLAQLKVIKNKRRVLLKGK